MLTGLETGQVCRDGGSTCLLSSPRGESRSVGPHQDHSLGPQLFRTLRLQASRIYRKRCAMVAIRLFLDVAGTPVRCSRAYDTRFCCQRQLQIRMVARKKYSLRHVRLTVSMRVPCPSAHRAESPRFTALVTPPPLSPIQNQGQSTTYNNSYGEKKTWWVVSSAVAHLLAISICL
jgi:hypothetical protein